LSPPGANNRIPRLAADGMGEVSDSPAPAGSCVPVDQPVSKNHLQPIRLTRTPSPTPRPAVVSAPPCLRVLSGLTPGPPAVRLGRQNPERGAEGAGQRRPQAPGQTAIPFSLPRFGESWKPAVAAGTGASASKLILTAFAPAWTWNEGTKGTA